ncbi:hypothetical protein O3M35_003206 [Rhynocoris fuscipes]|uniref:Uncharacterized protein n=1 Tax=Rhynocoris fuscipes TaxID=488301 RepID=A0AAW1CQ30_9HEMI
MINVDSFRPSCSTSYNVPWYHKRKLKDDVSAEFLPPPKMLITEEKMVSQLKGIHLSKDYTSHDGNSSSTLLEDTASLLGLDEKQNLPTLVICDEIRALQKTIEPVLPKHIMDRYHRPTNALVLWQPPVGDLGKYLKTFNKDNEEEVKEKPAQAPAAVVAADVEMSEDDDNNNNNNAAPQELLGQFSRTV